MTLSQYLEMNDLTLAQLAQACGTSASTILRIKEAEVAPSKRVMVAIWKATNGQVCPNDVFGLHPTVAGEAENCSSRKSQEAHD